RETLEEGSLGSVSPCDPKLQTPRGGLGSKGRETTKHYWQHNDLTEHEPVLHLH
ncbi:hypothetical protein FCV25MIE_21859, partial [Fagus crenata]